MEATKPFDTLFLDRDGVINVYRPNDYVKCIGEFIFTDGTLEALALLVNLFERIIVVTNQRGVGRGIMTQETLNEIHSYMVREITTHGGRIDAIYFCTDTDKDSPNRKPNPGMARQALQDFPTIDLSRSFMVGDSISDMEFAANAGIPAILIGEKNTSEQIESLSLYGQFPDLLTFARSVK